jgi:hypothetical protein
MKESANAELSLNSWRMILLIWHFKQQQKNSVALSPQVNYTDWATATCRLNLVPTFVDRGVSRGQRGGSPTVVNLSFLDRQFGTPPGIIKIKSCWAGHLEILSMIEEGII